MEKRRFFSIVTVVKNDLKGLGETLGSLKVQSCKDFEWIVVDGGSTDGSVELLKNEASIDPIWRSEDDNGIYDAMNKGVRMSGGKYIVFMNAGDLFADDDTLSDVREAIECSGAKEPVLFGGAVLEFPNGRRWYRRPRDATEYIWHGLPANHQATYYPAGWLRDNPYSDEYAYCGDYYVAARAVEAEIPFVYLAKAVARFRVGDKSYSHPVRLIVEAYRVQRNVVGVSLARRIISLLRRVIAIAGTTGIFRLPGRFKVQ